MPVIFGKEIPTKTLWIGGGLIAAAVAVVVYLRARAASTAAAADGNAAQPDQGQGQGYGMSIPAPSQQAADQYQQQLQNSQLEAQNIANQYQRQLVTQQQKQFEFQQGQEADLAPYLQKEEAAQLSAQTHYYQTVANTRISCPGGQGVAQSPDGQLYCRQKTSGSFLGIPLGDISRTVQNFIGGVEAAAPSIGYQAAQQASQYELGKLFPGRSTPTANQTARKQQEALPSTPPFFPSQMSGGAIGYEPYT